MIYRLPTADDEVILRDYINEHHKINENSISASHGLSKTPFLEWVDLMNQNANVGSKEMGKYLCLLCFDEDNLIGLLSIRYELSKELSNTYGDIGYGVRPSARKKGYATSMLNYALDVCKDKGLSEVILGCYKDNIASAKVIQKCGGILLEENDNYTQGRISQYYLIRL